MKIKITRKATLITGGSTTPNPLNLIELGFRGNDYRRDLSDYVIHFTKGTDDKEAYNNMMSILFSGCIKRGASAFGITRELSELRERNRAVCFSETPLGYLSNLANRRSLYGIGFRKNLIYSRGGNQICYVDSNSKFAKAFRKLITLGKPRQEDDRRTRSVDPLNPIWDICPFIEFTFRFGGQQQRFEWEREWRILNDFEFTPGEAEFLLLPNDLHAEARRFFEEAEKDKSGPAYFCPYIDPRWDLDQFLPLADRIAEKFKDAKEALEQYTNRLRLTGADVTEFEKFIATVSSIPALQQIPELIGQGREELVILNETSELTPEEINELINRKEPVSPLRKEDLLSPYSSLIEQTSTVEVDDLELGN